MAEQGTVEPVIVGLQTVLYKTSLPALVRALEALDNSSLVGRSEGRCNGFVVILGDASPSRLLSDQQAEELHARFPHIDQLRYHWFDANVGTSRGHNEMVTLMPPEVDRLVIANPDVVPDARALWRMAETFADPRVGMVEAKQLPVEHPKDYDPGSGQTSWATGAFSMTPRRLFEELGGFDAESFFMYCDDVDYSWRVREAGYDVIFQPSAVVFHDKSLTPRGRWMPTAAEVRYSAQAALLLAHKWSRDDHVSRILKFFEASREQAHRDAAAEFRTRHEEGRLVPQRDPDHRIGTFVGDNYAEHRFAL